jgi:cyclopropane fatty-acyl-phospholipid synthase-like methyltransferase
VNANEIVEIPALFEMLPPLSGLRILDLGCGYGEHCVKYIGMGADKVVGIDISESYRLPLMKTLHLRLYTKNWIWRIYQNLIHHLIWLLAL